MLITCPIVVLHNKRIEIDNRKKESVRSQLNINKKTINEIKV
jgi:hypothetical protein